MPGRRPGTFDFASRKTAIIRYSKDHTTRETAEHFGANVQCMRDYISRHKIPFKRSRVSFFASKHNDIMRLYRKGLTCREIADEIGGHPNSILAELHKDPSYKPKKYKRLDRHNRYCTKCNRQLPVTRYFICEVCETAFDEFGAIGDLPGEEHAIGY